MTSHRARLEDQDELLHRQVHPHMWKVVEGRPSSSAFRPSKKDDGQLSVARGSKVSAEEAYRRYVARGLSSSGVWSTVAEVTAVGLVAYDDPLPDDDAHAFIDFRDHKRGEIEHISNKLRSFACARLSYRPEGDAP